MSDAMKAGGANYMRGGQMMHEINGDQKEKGGAIAITAITADHTREDGFATEYLE